MKKTTTKKSEPLFDILNNISGKKMTAYDQTDAVLPVYLLLLWMRGASADNEAHYFLSNEYVNPYVFSLQKHDKLLYKLLCIANGGYGHPRFRFVKNNNEMDKDLIAKVARQYTCSINEAIDYIGLLSDEELERIKND